MEVNDNNIEEQIMLLADGELDATAAEAVMDYIGRHAAYQEMLDMYLSVKLEPEEEIIFPDKESLLREAPTALPLKTRTATPVWRWVAAAALLITISATAGVLLQQREPAGAPLVAIQYSASLNKLGIVPVPEDSLVAEVNTKQATKPEHRPVLKRQPDDPQHSNQVVVAATTKEDRSEVVTPLAMVREQSMPVTERPVAVLEKKEAIAVATSEFPSPWSPLKEETVEGINELVAQVRTLKEDVREKTQLLKKATIVLRLGNKEIALNK